MQTVHLPLTRSGQPSPQLIAYEDGPAPTDCGVVNQEQRLGERVDSRQQCEIWPRSRWVLRPHHRDRRPARRDRAYERQAPLSVSSIDRHSPSSVRWPGPFPRIEPFGIVWFARPAGSPMWRWRPSASCRKWTSPAIRSRAASTSARTRGIVGHGRRSDDQRLEDSSRPPTTRGSTADVQAPPAAYGPVGNRRGHAV